MSALLLLHCLAILRYVSKLWSWADECGSVLRPVSRGIEVFVSWHQEILICKYLRSSCCTFPHIITLSSQQSTFKHVCHTQLSLSLGSGSGIYTPSAGAESAVSSKSTNLRRCVGSRALGVRRKMTKYSLPKVDSAELQFLVKVPSYFEVNWTILRIDHQEG